MSAWSGFGDYVEKLGAPMTGQGDAANFEQMLEKALAAEAAAPTNAAAPPNEATPPNEAASTTYETTVCIIGGGVGGLAAAAALSDVGVACLVFERDASLESRRAGYGMTLSSDERGPLAHLKILQRCRELDCASTAHWVFAGDGSVLGYYGRGLAAAPECSEGRSGSLRVQRQQLREVLLERVDPSTINWNHQLSRVDESDDQVVATFTNGATCRCQALVGCDGVRSRVRELREARLPIELRRPLADVGVGVVVGLSTFRHDLIEGRGFYVLDGKARLFTMPFSATLTMWQLSFGMGAIDLAGDLLKQCERYVATWKDIGGVAASLIRDAATPPMSFQVVT